MQQASTPPRNTALYIRQSLDKTGEGLAVERQLEDCQTRAQALGWTVGRVYRDNDVSASSTKPRPAYVEMLAALEAGHHTAVIVWDLDRLTRRPIEIEHFIDLADRRGIALASVGGDVDLSTDNGRLFARIKGAVARAEVERKSARQKRAYQQQAEAGLPHVTHRPFGYELDGMTQVPGEVEALRQMYKMTVAGYGYQAVAYWLNENGYRTADGNLFYPVTVRRVLMRPRYAGVREYLGQTFSAQWPAVFTVDEFQHLQHIIRMRSERSKDRPVARKFLLTGLLYCGKCGKPLTGRNAMRPKDKREATYVCLKLGGAKRVKACGGVSRGALPLDDYIRSLVIYRLDTPELGALLAQNGDGNENELRTLIEQRQLKADRKVALADDYGDGTLTKTEYTRQKARLDAVIHDLDERLSELQRASTPLDIRPGERVGEA